MKHRDGGGADNSRATADYVADMTAELAEMARRQRLPMLGYLLEMARLEAQQAARLSPARTPDLN